MTQSAPAHSPEVFLADTRHFHTLYTGGDHGRLSEAFLDALGYFQRATYLDPVLAGATITPFLKSFFALFTQADYIVPKEYVARFIRCNALLSNLTAMSSFRTTDVFLDILHHQPSNFVKILTLYSARNRVRFDPAAFFDGNAALASLWYFQFCAVYKSGVMRPEVAGHLTRHLRAADPRLLPAEGLADAYYASTYINGGLDRLIKPRINKTVRRHAGITVTAMPDPKKIAVISDLWSPTHSVYRNYAAFVRELKKTYHLTLFHILMPREALDTAMFDEVHRLDMTPDRLAGQLAGGYALAYFPDVGMTDPSILLANCRIAPIQVSSPGHSVSSWGAQIDYFISGSDVEPKEAPERNYSERLVLLPGMGAVHNRPLYTPAGIAKTTPEILVNCPWSGHKITAGFLRTLNTLIGRAGRPLRLRIFPNTGIMRDNGCVPFIEDLRAGLGDKAQVEVRTSLPYGDYMRLMEEGDLTLDSFHFGGCNSIADSLFLRKPTVVREGDKWYNRIGPAMLRMVGLEEFVCASEEEYIEKSLWLIDDTEKRMQVKAVLDAADLEATLFGDRHAPAFRRAVDYLIASHDTRKTQDRSPVVIS